MDRVGRQGSDELMEEVMVSKDEVEEARMIRWLERDRWTEGRQDWGF